MRLAQELGDSAIDAEALGNRIAALPGINEETREYTVRVKAAALVLAKASRALHIDATCDLSLFFDEVPRQGVRGPYRVKREHLTDQPITAAAVPPSD